LKSEFHITHHLSSGIEQRHRISKVLDSACLNCSEKLSEGAMQSL
jgi:hypothetical protein